MFALLSLSWCFLGRPQPTINIVILIGSDLIIFSLLFKFSKPGFDLEIWITAMITMKIIMAIITMMTVMMMMIVTMMIIAILTFIIHGDHI